ARCAGGSRRDWAAIHRGMGPNPVDRRGPRAPDRVRARASDSESAAPAGGARSLVACKAAWSICGPACAGMRLPRESGTKAFAGSVAGPRGHAVSDRRRPIPVQLPRRPETTGVGGKLRVTGTGRDDVRATGDGESRGVWPARERLQHLRISEQTRVPGRDHLDVVADGERAEAESLNSFIWRPRSAAR